VAGQGLAPVGVMDTQGPKPLHPGPFAVFEFPGSRSTQYHEEDGPVSVSVMVTFFGGPRDGEASMLSSGDPPGVLIVDDSGGRYEWRDGRYRWKSWPYEVVID
jgi:hypothetical protein